LPRRFVRQTFDIIDGGNLIAIASTFTFGREDLLPAVFQRIVNKLNVEAGGALDKFKYYLERHIDLDGDEHGPMAQRLVLSLCGPDESRRKVAEQSRRRWTASTLGRSYGTAFSRRYGGRGGRPLVVDGDGGLSDWPIQSRWR
jgi:hypothetical protein